MEHEKHLPQMTPEPQRPEPVKGCLACARLVDERYRALGSVNLSGVTDANVRLRVHVERDH